MTYIDHRFTDLIFWTSAWLEEVLTLQMPVDDTKRLGRIIRWLQVDSLIFDRSGQLSQAQEKVRRENWLNPVAESDAYSAWIRINYNLAQTKRLLSSDDPGDYGVIYYASDLLRFKDDDRNLARCLGLVLVIGR